VRRRPDLAERNRARAKHGHTRGHRPSGTWKSWRSMLGRGLGRADRNRYADRGIRVCGRWLTFENFLVDMGERPPGTSIERIDNARGYEPGTCRWATATEQARNRRSNLLITVDGETLPLVEWAARSGVGRATIAHRIKVGWPAREAVFAPADRVANGRWRRTA
jgi:hypothetical protein